ncbi:MAG: hypothetical protein A2992_07435 [Elusimicrobia bacterium RIFCSPLOWO2_01_FULL_59_12]|nr:MAG: hypothetical protein A2992_07435 [Elusimicrobia bacterium RIFCSPLOWO2_01_FULL_59_12]
MSTLDAILAKKKELEAKLIPVEDEIKDLETRNIDSEVLRRQLGNFLAVFKKLSYYDQREAMQLLVKDVAFDGQTKWVKTNLRPLPKVWGDLTVLEGMLVPLKPATQPGGFAGPCGVSQAPSATLRADGSACRVADPKTDGNRTPTEQMNAVLGAMFTPVAYFQFSDTIPFDYVNRKKGLILLVSPQEATLIRSKQRRYRPLREPSIKRMLQLGVRLGFELLQDPKLSRVALAKRHRLEPTVLTRLLHLTKLAPEIQEYIRAMPATQRAGPITLGRLVPLARSPDHSHQLEEFKNLLIRPARARRRPSPTEALSNKINLKATEKIQAALPR